MVGQSEASAWSSKGRTISGGGGTQRPEQINGIRIIFQKKEENKVERANTSPFIGRCRAPR